MRDVPLVGAGKVPIFIPVPDLSRMLMQATSTLSEFSGLRVLSGLYLFQSSSIAAASAIAPRRAKRARKLLTYPFPFLSRLLCRSRLPFRRRSYRVISGLLLAQTFGAFSVPFLGFICATFWQNFGPFFGIYLRHFLAFDQSGSRSRVFMICWPFIVGAT
jgi:hypothetical protein